MKEFVEAVKRLVDLMPSGAALAQFYAHDELVKVREMLGEMEKPDPRPTSQIIGNVVHTIDLDDDRRVSAMEAKGGLHIVFCSHGKEERIGLSFEAIDAVTQLRNKIKPSTDVSESFVGLLHEFMRGEKLLKSEPHQ